ncbi:MAG: biopolymer transporter ExbD [Gemmatimonadales bacterium]|nr:MAG: biopolymer transporter ExbD [Gemmatimonadales bacterium]
MHRDAGPRGAGVSRRRRQRNALAQNAEINVTSLIDVAFTLLVIFIITAPALQGGIELRLPETDIQPITAQDDPFIVSVDADGLIWIGEDTQVPRDEFRTALPRFLDLAGASDVYIKADRDARHGDVAFVKGIAVTEARNRGGGIWELMDPDTQN